MNELDTAGHVRATVTPANHEPNMLTPEQITALRPGHDLDRAVHEYVFGRSGRPMKYSTTGAALEILDVMPLRVGRFRDSDPEMKPERPFFCRFRLGQDATPEDYLITSATAAAALCKGALLHKHITANADHKG